MLQSGQIIQEKGLEMTWRGWSMQEDAKDCLVVLVGYIVDHERRCFSLQITELYKMNPIQLGQALHCIQYLQDRVWIDVSSIDAWLIHAWEALPLPAARYVPSTFVPPITAASGSDPTEEEMDMFRGLFNELPERGTPCPLETLICVLNC